MTNPSPALPNRPFRTDLLLLLLLGFWACAQLAWWLASDRLNPLWDEAGYLNRALDAAEVLRAGGWKAIANLYYQTLGPRPTFAFVLLAQPVLLLFGPELDLVIFFTNAPIFCAVLYATFWLGRWAFDTRTGLLSAFLIATQPQISLLSGVYWPHFSAVAVTVVGTCLLLASDRLRRPGPVLAFGLLLGVGLLMRPVYPALFLFGPALLTCFAALRGGPEDPWPSDPPGRARRLLSRAFDPCLRVMGPAMVLTLAVAGPFYLHIWNKMTRFINRVGDEQAVAWPERSSIFYYLHDLPKDTSWAFVGLLIAGVAAAIWYRSRPALWLIAAFSISFFPVSWSDNRAFYYFAPTYPLLTVLATGWISLLGSRTLRRGLTALVLGLGAVLYTTTNWYPQALPTALHGLLATQVKNVPETVDWGLPAVAERIHEDWSSRNGENARAPRVGQIAAHKIYSVETFHFFARAAGHSFDYISTFRVRENFLHADYLLLRVDHRPSPRNKPMGRWFADTAKAALETGLPGLEEIERWKTFGRGELVLLRRKQPANSKSLLRWAELLGRTNRPLAIKRLTFEHRSLPRKAPDWSCLAVALGHLHLQAGDLDDAEAWYRKAQKHPKRAARCWRLSLRPPDAPQFTEDQRLFLKRIEASLALATPTPVPDPTNHHRSQP